MSLAFWQSSVALGDAVDVPGNDRLPKGAVIRSGTDRFRQEGEVPQVKYSPDGKKLASISRDAVIL